MDETTPEEKFQRLLEVCAELGWIFAMDDSDDGNIHGIIVGTKEYVAEIVNEIDEDETYIIGKYGPAPEEELH